MAEFLKSLGAFVWVGSAYLSGAYWKVLGRGILIVPYLVTLLFWWVVGTPSPDAWAAIGVSFALVGVVQYLGHRIGGILPWP